MDVRHVQDGVEVAYVNDGCFPRGFGRFVATGAARPGAATAILAHGV
jgi:hypothetical protein